MWKGLVTNMNKRVNIRISETVDKFFDMRASETGVSKSALMNLAMEEYIRSYLAMEELPRLIEFAKEELKS